MKYRKVTAIIPSLSFEKVEKDLMSLGVKGMTVSQVQGVGEYRNYYTNDHLTDCTRIEVFTDADKASEIATTIAKSAYQGLSNDGIIAILPVEEFIHIREFNEQNN